MINQNKLYFKNLGVSSGAGSSGQVSISYLAATLEETPIFLR